MRYSTLAMGLAKGYSSAPCLLYISAKGDTNSGGSVRVIVGQMENGNVTVPLVVERMLYKINLCVHVAHMTFDTELRLVGQPALLTQKRRFVTDNLQ
jgi:hypothetical protein